jgi:hypothetical protein
MLSRYPEADKRKNHIASGNQFASKSTERRRREANKDNLQTLKSCLPTGQGELVRLERKRSLANVSSLG